MSSSSPRERQLSTGRDVLEGREWKRAWRALSHGEKWRIIWSVNRGRAVADERHAWLAARVAADAGRRRGLTRRVALFAAAAMLLNLVAQIVERHWLLAAFHFITLLVLSVALVVAQGSPAQLAAAEAANHALAERSGGPL